MANIFKNIDNMAKQAAKFMTKAQRAIIEREGDNIYISDGYWCLKVPVMLYEARFRCISPLYVEMEQDGVKSTGGSAFNIPQGNGYQTGVLTGCWNSTQNGITENYHTVNISKFTLDVHNVCGKDGTARLCYCEDGTAIFLNTDFIGMVQNVSYERIESSGKRFNAVMFRDGGFEIEALILPIRTDYVNVADIFAGIGTASKTNENAA